MLTSIMIDLEKIFNAQKDPYIGLFVEITSRNCEVAWLGEYLEIFESIRADAEAVRPLEEWPLRRSCVFSHRHI